MLLELRNYEENARIGSGNLKTTGRASHHHDEYGVIPVRETFMFSFIFSYNYPMLLQQNIYVYVSFFFKVIN